MTAMNKRPYSLSELASHVGGVVEGDGSVVISAVGTRQALPAIKSHFLLIRNINHS